MRGRSSQFRFLEQREGDSTSMETKVGQTSLSIGFDQMRRSERTLISPNVRSTGVSNAEIERNEKTWLLWQVDINSPKSVCLRSPGASAPLRQHSGGTQVM
jgi:hypothetical protein